MKNRLLPFALLLLLPLSVIEKGSPVFVYAASEYTPTLISVKTDVKNIDTSDDSEAEIKTYYSNLSSLSSNELKGTNLLKNLKPILQNNSKYMNYENTKYAMMITDRDWIQSPLSGSTYSYNTAPKMHVIYRSDNGTTSSPTFTGTHEKFDGSNPEKDSDYILNKEHTWPKAMGFNKSGNYEKRPSGTDLHALMMADNNVNIQHNCYPYGDKTTVCKLGSYTTSEKSSSLRNSKGWTYTVNGMTFFEPTDEFKGDIARAQFYMVARYNNLEGDTLNTLGDGSILEANLSLTNITKSNYLGTTTTDSTSSKVVSYGDLDTLLRWHKLDPVSDYEIHRNNLIANNYQNNRNPFIDYPEWVDAIWGGSSNYANPNEDEISTYGNTGLEISGVESIGIGSTTTLTAKVKDGYVDTNQTIIWESSDQTVATITSAGKVTGKKAGKVTITAYTQDSTFCATFTLNVTDVTVVEPTSISLNSSQITLEEGKTATLTATVSPNNASDKTVTWTSNNTSVATVSNGVVTAKAAGTATITAKTSNNLTATCKITVTKKVINPTSITLDKTNLELKEGETAALTAAVLPDNSTDKTITWSSSNTSIATVSSTGLVTAKEAGSAVISAKTVNNLTASCTVNVTKEDVPNPEPPVEEDIILDGANAIDTFSITNDSYPSKLTAYGTEDIFKCTSNKYGDSIEGSGDLAASTSYLQANSSSNSSLGIDFYNKTAINGAISSLEIKFNEEKLTTTTKDISIYFSTTPITKKVQLTSLTAHSKLSFKKSGTNPQTITIDPLESYQYFAITSSNAIYLDYLTFTYVNYEREASIWATSFLNSTGNICQANGNTSFNSLKSVWSTNKTNFNTISTPSQKLIRYIESATFDNNSYKTNIENAIERYSFIVNRAGYEELEDFIAGIRTNNSRGNFFNVYLPEENSYIYLVVVIAIGVSFIPLVYYIIKKKKLNN